jgi:hypothetical protein
MFIKTKRVRRANRTYEYLTLAESVRIDGTNTHRILYRLGEATALRESGELDRIIVALQAHAERRYVDLDGLEVDVAPMIGTMAAVRQLWDELGLEQLFTTIADEAGVSWSLADAVFAMLAGRLIDPASKRRTHRWIVDDVVAPEGFSFPTLEQYYRALDVVHAKQGPDRTARLRRRLRPDQPRPDARVLRPDLDLPGGRPGRSPQVSVQGVRLLARPT